MTRIYRLEIGYPEGSRTGYGDTMPGWQPSDWKPGDFFTHVPFDEGEAYSDSSGEFRWPRERLFLSRSGVDLRARQLLDCGCTVRVLVSDPVTWPGGPDA